jgi:hypothetical protein
MRVRWSYCLGGIGLAVASLVVGIEVEKATARTGGSASTIDRSFKGDRLTPTHPGMRPSTAPSSQPKLPDGCESSASTIRSKPIIERCFATAPASSVLG